ncbi:hypothetical protein LCGC14_1297730 [marine sediment metagenome]|uniref:Sulfotransferase domain-containing protein n=1 Tax=marine sediment metagenome TaxID=412755 RepID=A0A0F9KS51_9ZZZZ
MKDVFIRIQKAGGHSLNRAIKGAGVGMLGHSYSYLLGPLVCGWEQDQYDVEFPAFDPRGYDRIYALVRNPFDILVSYYHHNDYPDMFPQTRSGWLSCNNVGGFTSWDQFLDAYIDPGYSWHLPPMKTSMFSFAYDEKSELIITDFFKLEEAEKLSDFLIGRGGSAIEKINVNRCYDRKQEFYTKNQILKLKQIWRRDLEYFQYKAPQ